MKNPSPLYGTVAAVSTTPLSSTPSNASLTQPYPAGACPCRIYPIDERLLNLSHRLPASYQPRNPRESLARYKSFLGLCSGQNQLLLLLYLTYKISPRMGRFTLFTTSPGLLTQYRRFRSSILAGFRRRSVLW